MDAQNEVALTGRVAAPSQQRTMPSGDVLVSWRLVVDRPPPRRRLRPGSRPATVDTLECVVWSAALRRTAAAFQVCDVVAVEGALRRRFWRSGAGVTSKYEVEVAGRAD